jgi:hypothetical protein
MLTATASVALVPTRAHATERFAIVVGNNEGAPERARLWFAERDAEQFAHTLSELGDFTADHVRLLKGKSPNEIRAELDRIEAELAQLSDRGNRSLLVFYFSGHADAQGLQLGAEHLPFSELKERVEHSHANVKVAIVDACGAGALTQVKGARAAPELNFPLPDEEMVQGVALVASTAVGELAQESAELEGSFFSHHLEVALRGAGDADGDHQVTLAEAFRYAAGRTTLGTASTEAGPQHPTYALQMSGRGDVVLADLRRAEARLIFPAEPTALYVLHGPGGFVAEVPGEPQSFSLALPAGRFTIERRRDNVLESGSFDLTSGTTHSLPSFQQVSFELAQRKGNLGLGIEADASAGSSTGLLPGSDASFGGSVAAAVPLGIFRVRIDLGFNQANGTSNTFRYTLRSYGVGATLLVPLLAKGRFALEMGPRFGYAWDVETAGDGYGNRSVGEGSVGVLLWPTVLVGPVRIGLELRADVHRFSLNGESILQPVASGALTVGHLF